MKSVPWGDVPDTNVLPNCIVSATLETLAKGETKANERSSGGKLKYNLTARITAPKALKGMNVFENYVIGTDDDPDAEENDTLIQSIGLKRMKRMFKAAGADMNTNAPPLKLFTSVKGKTVLFEIEKKSGQFPNNVVAVYAEGEETPRLLDEDGEAVGPNGGRPKRATAKPAAAAAEEEEEAVEVAEPAPARRKVAKPAAAEAEESEGEEAPAPAPAPKAKAKATAAPAKLKDPVKCSACGELVERGEFDAHLEEKHADEEE